MDKGTDGAADKRVNKKAWRARAQTERSGLAIDSDGHRKVLEPFLAANVDPELMIVMYDAMPGEVDLAGLVEVHPAPETRFAVTRTPGEGYHLTVHPIGGPIEKHPYGYDQPTEDAPQVADNRIGAVLVPALAFAKDGSRLGRGKGYYDRFLDRLGDGVLFVGITGGYVVDELPTESFDISMTHLATADAVVGVTAG